MHFTLRQLRAAIAVAKRGNFRRAADELKLSQPALSLSIAELERSLGVTLFHRTSRMVAPTEIGAAFLPGAERLVVELDRLVSDVAKNAEARAGRVVVTCLASVAGRVIPAVINECSRRYPAIDIDIRDDLAGRMAEVVRHGEADFAITLAPRSLAEDLVFEPLFSESFFVVCQKSHRFAKASKVRWRQLEGETFIAFSTASGTHAMIDAEIIRARVSLGRRVTVTQLATVLGMLEEGVGVSVLPQLALPVERHPRLIVRPLIDPMLERTIGLLQRRDRSLSPAAAAFREVLFDTVAMQEAAPRPSRRATRRRA